MNPTPTGYYREGRIVIERRLDLSPGEAWDALTASEHTARWIGPWSGDPATGSIDLTMTAEEGSPSMPLRIDKCEAPVRVAVIAGEGEDVWMLFGEVRAAGEGENGAVIALSQITDDPEKTSAIGPGWEFYLDRLVAAETGGDPEAIDFDDYYPSMAGYYRALPG